MTDDLGVVERLRERLAAGEPGAPVHAAAVTALGRRRLRRRRLREVGAAAAAVAVVAVGGALAVGTADQARPPVAPVDREQVDHPSGMAEELDDLRSEAAARASLGPTLLRIRNRTSGTVTLTSTAGGETILVEPGRSVRLASEGACALLPLRAAAEDGTDLGEYDEPCAGQTWTIGGP